MNIRELVGPDGSDGWIALVPSELVGTEISAYLMGGNSLPVHEFPLPDGQLVLAGSFAHGTVKEEPIPRQPLARRAAANQAKSRS